jgi:hypothetical protein
MTLNDKHKEYELMKNSDQRTIKVEIPGGPILVCMHSWDYSSNLNQSSFKTVTPVKVVHSLLKVEKIDLSPVTTTMVYKITVYRQQQSNLKNNGRESERGRSRFR